MSLKTKEKDELPKFCDFFCKYALFTDPNSIGGCRREVAVWCEKIKKYNNKNNKCIAKK